MDIGVITIFVLAVFVGELLLRSAFSAVPASSAVPAWLF